MEAIEHQSEKLGVVSLDTIAGVQRALKELGHDPGKIDGIDGPNTRSGVRAFQLQTGIQVDGIAGPVTKRALLAALDHIATPEGTVEGAVAAAADVVRSITG